MLDVVAGQHDQRALGRKLPVQQVLPDAPGALEGFLIGEAAPPLARALGEEHPIRRRLGPVLQPVDEGSGISGQAVRRAHVHDTAGTALDLHVPRPEGDLASVPHRSLRIPNPKEERT